MKRTCIICGAKMGKTMVDTSLYWGDSPRHIISNIPAYRCKCDEILYDHDTAEMLLDLSKRVGKYYEDRGANKQEQ